MQITLKKILGSCLFAAVLLLVGSRVSFAGIGISATLGSLPPERITFAGVGAHGIFDPSVALDPVTGRLWMSYSAVEGPTNNVNVVAIRLAYSNDQGKTWIGSSSGGLISNFLDVSIPLPPPNNAGTWINEVSQLIYDPGAIPAERWKILWHHYLVVNGARLFEHGWIAMKVASTPQGLAAAPEIKLFGGYLYNAGNNIAGGGSRSPVGGAPLIQLDIAIPELNSCLFTEPGLYATKGALYLSLQCEHFAGTQVDDRLIVLLKCTSPCNTGSAASWSYLGTALKKSDATAFGFDFGFAAPSMFASGKDVYLVVTGANLVTPPVGIPYAKYSGCRVFKFADIETAKLESIGVQPTLVGSVDGTAGSFNGACAYHVSASKSGMLFGEINTAVVDTFQMFRSHINFRSKTTGPGTPR